MIYEARNSDLGETKYRWAWYMGELWGIFFRTILLRS